MYPGLTDAAKEIVLDSSTTANLIQALLPIIFKSKLQREVISVADHGFLIDKATEFPVLSGHRFYAI